MKRSAENYPDGSLAAPYAPVPTDPVLRAFPAQVEHLMPPADDIPDEFWEDNSYSELFVQWFYFGGIEASEVLLRDDRPGQVEGEPGLEWFTRAMHHLEPLMRSFQPKHQYKTAAFAFLCAQWFLAVRCPWTTDQRETLRGQGLDYDTPPRIFGDAEAFKQADALREAERAACADPDTQPIPIQRVE